MVAHDDDVRKAKRRGAKKPKVEKYLTFGECGVRGCVRVHVWRVGRRPAPPRPGLQTRSLTCRPPSLMRSSASRMKRPRTRASWWTRCRWRIVLRGPLRGCAARVGRRRRRRGAGSARGN